MTSPCTLRGRRELRGEFSRLSPSRITFVTFVTFVTFITFVTFVTFVTFIVRITDYTDYGITQIFCFSLRDLAWVLAG